MSNSNNSQHEIEESGLVSAIWILACNDETSLMLYDSVKFRLGLPDSYDVEKLIRKNAELFRHKIPGSALKQWKAEMLAGKRRPSFLIEIDDVNERQKIIDSLTPNDGFRSQFRARADSPRSDISIINWGLEHIERLRKAKIEAKDERWKKWKEMWIPSISIFVALLTVLLTSYWQYQNIRSQKQIKEFEVSFKPKQDGYAQYMSLVSQSFDSAVKDSQAPSPIVKNKERLLNNLRNLDESFYRIEFFLPAEKRESMREMHQQFQSFITNIYESDYQALTEEQKMEKIDKFIEFSHYFRDQLSASLFSEIK